jgi:hypothetical protein
MSLTFREKEASPDDFTEHPSHEARLDEFIALCLQDIPAGLDAVKQEAFAVANVQEADDRRIRELFHP